MSLARIVPARKGASETTWEDQYRSALEERGSIGAAGLNEIRRCTDAAFQFIGHAFDGRPEDSVAGAIVGAVQSGKTGLMINLAARALDQGFRCVIVLAGLRDDLRTQTALRFQRDLLQRGDLIPQEDGGGCTHPLGIGYHGVRRDCWAPFWKDDVNHDEAFSYMFSSRLRRGESALAVAKKNVTTLNHLRAAYEFALVQMAGQQLPMLVIDDECDEASVSADDEAPTPERIADVWAGLGQQVAYIGFTATPAANLLQDPDSRLFPGDFVLTLRTPGNLDTKLTYLEPNPDQRYTGGFAFYQLLDRHQRPNFLVEAGMSAQEFRGAAGNDDELEQAILAYMVSGAIRLVEQGLPGFDDPKRLPEPHTMLAHTESTITSHWRLCERIVRLIRRRGGSPEEVRGNIARVRPIARISAADLRRWLDADPDAWRAWHEEFRRSRNLLLEISPDRTRGEFPSWSRVQEALDSVFQAVKLRVVNSDDSSVDDPLQFQPTYATGGIRPPRDVYSMIIGGNRLSRGLTLEGLCVSYYTRSSITMVEDTTVQRERWFGYRGRHLEFCRVFTHRSLAIRLRRFHEHDEDLRRQLAWNVENGRPPADATFRFLTIRDSVPTSKLGRGRGPLRLDVSGTRVFIDRVQMGESEAERAAAARNEDLAAEIAHNIHADGGPLVHDGRDLGYVREAVPGIEIAKLLERLTYTFHNPDPVRGVGWNLRGFYRPYDPQRPVTDYGFPPSSDPYLIAAFIRYWDDAYSQAALESGASRFRAADGVSDWSPCAAPSFNLAVRFGSLRPTGSSPFTFQLLDREIDAGGVVGSRWGGRRGGVGDEWIDVSPPPTDPDAPRSRGEPGLALVHVIGRQAKGRKGLGQEYAYDRPCLGLVIPAGGPSLEVVLAEGRV